MFWSICPSLNSYKLTEGATLHFVSGHVLDARFIFVSGSSRLEIRTLDPFSTPSRLELNLKREDCKKVFDYPTVFLPCSHQNDRLPGYQPVNSGSLYCSLLGHEPLRSVLNLFLICPPLYLSFILLFSFSFQSHFFLNFISTPFGFLRVSFNCLVPFLLQSLVSVTQKG